MASISQKKNNINNENQIQKFSSKGNTVRGVNLSYYPLSSSYQGKNIQHSQQQTKVPSFLEFASVPQSLPVAANEVSQSQFCGSKGIDL